MTSDWFLADDKRSAPEGVSLERFRADVVAHARRKMDLSPDPTEQEYTATANAVFDLSHGMLRHDPDVRYESYVFMVILYFLRGTDGMAGPDV